MESKLEYLREIKGLIQNATPESLELSLKNCHHEGLFSLVIGGTKPGHLRRIFIANQEIKPFVIQLHTHKYGVKITAVKGIITHHQAYKTEMIKGSHTVSISEFIYNTPLNGGNGLKYVKETNLTLKDSILPIGSTVILNYRDIHTVSCSQHSIWIVEELPGDFEEQLYSSRLFGVPFKLNKNWYGKLNTGTIGQLRALVSIEVNWLIKLYESINL